MVQYISICDCKPFRMFLLNFVFYLFVLSYFLITKPFNVLCFSYYFLFTPKASGLFFHLSPFREGSKRIPDLFSKMGNINRICEKMKSFRIVKVICCCSFYLKPNSDLWWLRKENPISKKEKYYHLKLIYTYFY